MKRKLEISRLSDGTITNIKMNIKNKNVLIIGSPASGKTTFANELSKNNPHKVFHADDYMEHGYKQALYVMMEDIKACQSCTIIEGIQGYRLLRKGVELNVYYPDLVIEMQITKEKQAEIYANERDPSKLKYLRGFDGMHQKILNDYFTMVGERKPEWVKVNIHK